MMPKSTKTIGIDARFYGPTGKGLGRYTKEVVDRVTAADTESNYVIFMSPANFHEFTPPNERVKKILVKTRWYTLAEQFVLAFLVAKHKIDLFHTPHFNAPVFAPCKLVVTIHDLILLNFSTERATTLSSAKYKIKYLGYKFVIWLAMARSKKIIAVSQFTKDDIVRNFGINPDKVVVTLEGVADFEAAGNVDGRILDKLEVSKPFFLYIGNAYPHKNLEGLIKTYAELSQEQVLPQLILVGKEDYFYKRVKDLAESLNLWSAGTRSNKVVFAGYLTDAELAALFKEALFYIFPSFYEGFGLPPLEAMAHGLPVLSSNLSCLPEILGDAAAYFDPNDQADFKSAIRDMISNDGKRAELIKLGFEQVKKYSWKECADDALKVYRQYL
jgi:glycosyltransferase involved in cell wall biosynthesis